MLRHLIRTNRTALLTRSIRPHATRACIPASSAYPIVGHKTMVAPFHSTPSRRAPPLVALLATVLKSSTSLEIVRTAARIFLTFLPAIMIKNHKSRKKLKYAHLHGIPQSEETVARVKRQIKIRSYLLCSLFMVPVTLLWATVIASLEQTPLTGRWRLIVLSPEEEEEIAEQLAGPGWYSAVGGIIAADGPARIIPNTDWRYTWVNSTLRMLEATIPILTNEPTCHNSWFDEDQDHPPMPPPTSYPLRPRPRASEYLRRLCDNICEGKGFTPPIPRTPHQIAGPPYSLLLVEKPESPNALSYGFGPNGGGGIVVYSGFLDEILARMPMNANPPTEEPKSWFTSLFGALFSSPPPRHPTPTREQTTELAILLAHELSHLVLSHHLETLSSATVILPGVISLIMDMVRGFLYPLTVFLGPFVNDAVANIGKVGSGELVKIGELCTSVTQEIEADVVSARLLAHAGFDARDAVRFWGNPPSNTKSVDNANTGGELSLDKRLAMALWSQAHPVKELRADALRQELARWEDERRRQVAVSREKVKKTGGDMWTDLFPYVHLVSD